MIWNRSWILTIHKVRILQKISLKKHFGLQKWGKKYTTAGYNGVRMVIVGHLKMFEILVVSFSSYKYSIFIVNWFKLVSIQNDTVKISFQDVKKLTEKLLASYKYLHWKFPFFFNVHTYIYLIYFWNIWWLETLKVCWLGLSELNESSSLASSLLGTIQPNI